MGDEKRLELFMEFMTHRIMSAMDKHSIVVGTKWDVNNMVMLEVTNLLECDFKSTTDDVCAPIKEYFDDFSHR